jgi:hypothetical protein
LAPNSTDVQPLAQADFPHLSGLSETETDDNTTGVVVESLLPSYKEVLSPTPLPTYQGSSLIHSFTSESEQFTVENLTSKIEKDYTWSRGHGFEHSPIKTRSARSKEGNSFFLPAGTFITQFVVKVKDG